MLAPALHDERPVRRAATGGFTLIELMIVVVIVGVLAAVAVLAYGRYVRSGRATEVVKVIAELKTREEQYQTDYGRYLPTEGFFPDPINGGSNETLFEAVPASWQTLRANPGKKGLYCQYRVYTGGAGEAPSEEIGQQLYGTAPNTNYYYVVAKCDWKPGDPMSIYAQRGDRTDMAKQNEGE